MPDLPYKSIAERLPSLTADSLTAIIFPTMYNQIIKNSTQFIRNFWPILTLNLLCIIFIILPFVLSNNLTSWDFAGHKFAIDFTGQNLFPDLKGWNPYTSLGYPQGTFYPPFVHYFIAALNIVTGSSIIWIKILFAITFLMLPYSIFFFSKQIAKQIKTKTEIKNLQTILLAITLSAVFVIIIAPANFGGSLKSFLQIGLINNFFILPILFCYLGLLFSFDKKISWLRILGLATLLTIIMLSHLVLGLIAVIFTITIWLKDYFIAGKVKTRLYSAFFSPTLKVLTITFITTSFFYLPYIKFSKYLTPNLPQRSPLILSMLIVSLLLTFFYLNFKRQNSLFRVFSFTLLLLSLLPFLDAIAVRLNIDINFQLVQPYRIFAVVLFLSIPWIMLNKIAFVGNDGKLAKVLSKTTKVFLRGNILIALMSLLLVATAGLFLRIDFGQRDYESIYLSKNAYELQGNFLNQYTSNDIYYLNRAPYYAAVSENPKLASLDTQFNESSYLINFFYSLKKSLREVETVETINAGYIETYNPGAFRAKQAVELFNIRYLLFTDGSQVKPGLCKDSPIPFAKRVSRNADLDQPYIFACEIYRNPGLQTTIAKVVDEKDWDLAVLDWWIGQNNNVLVQSASGLKDLMPVNVFDGDIEWSDNFQQFNIKNESSEDSVLVLPIQYNPDWKAYDKGNNTKELQIVRVSPNLLGIKGSSTGGITVKYVKSPFENYLKFISFAVLGILETTWVVMWVRKKI
jgi:hypothetical protein